MKTRLLIIIGSVLIITIASTFILNYYTDEEIKSQKFRDEQIDRIFKRCDYQKRMNERNGIGLDGNKLDHQPLYFWNNSTHHLDNNTCKWQTIEQYESDAKLRDALARCWIGNSKFLDEDFTLWSNETHYIDTDTCLITETNSESITDSLKIPNAERDSKLAAGYKLYPSVGWVHPDDLGNQEPRYMDNPNNPGELILDLDAMLQYQKVVDWCHRESLGLGVLDIGLSFNNETHYIDNNNCKWQKIESESVKIKVCRGEYDPEWCGEGTNP